MRSRRSAKKTIEDMTNEILKRPPGVERDAKLNLIETIASQMSWIDLVNRIKYRNRGVAIQRAHWYQD